MPLAAPVAVDHGARKVLELGGGGSNPIALCGAYPDLFVSRPTSIVLEPRRRVWVMALCETTQVWT